MQLTYAPSRNGTPDAGEIVWAWVPYAEADGRGKDRPLLVIAADGVSSRYAVRLTSREPDDPARYVALGNGGWDARGRASWVDLTRLYSVPRDGMRREGATLDRRRYEVVAAALSRRYGWRR